MEKEFVVYKDDLTKYNSIDEIGFSPTEDLYQASYNQYIIDCGWYEGDNNGSFITYLIVDNNWELPIVKFITSTISDAQWTIEACKNYVNSK